MPFTPLTTINNIGVTTASGGGGTTFTVNQSGYYLVTYGCCVSVAGGTNTASVALNLNGSLIPGTGIALEEDGNDGQSATVILQLTAGQTLAIQNTNTGGSITMAGTPTRNSAYITLTFIRN